MSIVAYVSRNSMERHRAIWRGNAALAGHIDQFNRSGQAMVFYVGRRRKGRITAPIVDSIDRLFFLEQGRSRKTMKTRKLKDIFVDQDAEKIIRVRILRRSM